MKNWFLSLSGAITLTIISLLIFLGRAFVDFYYVFGEFGLDVSIVFFLLIIAIGTLVSYCPSPCRTGWPLGEILIWLSLVFGVLASAATGFQIWSGQPRSLQNPTGAES
jgi:hypothetical protein